MLIFACGILGIALLFIRLLDYGSAQNASKNYLSRHPRAKVMGPYGIRAVIFFSLSLLMVVTLFASARNTTDENKAILVLLILIMLSEVINSLSYHRVYVGEKEILIKDKQIDYKRIKSVSKKRLVGTFKITLFNNDTILAPNACFKAVVEGAKIKNAPK